MDYDPTRAVPVTVEEAERQLAAAGGALYASQPLFNLSVERNSRGATWKAHVGHEGVPLHVALDALDQAVAEMGRRYGEIANG